MLDAPHARAPLSPDALSALAAATPAAAPGRKPPGGRPPSPATTSPAPPARPLAPRSPESAALVDLVRERAFGGSAESDLFGPGVCGPGPAGVAVDQPPCDVLFAAGSEPRDPDDAFRALRWGGQFVYASRDRSAVAALPEQFVRRGFEIERPPAFVR
ncbi:MAG: hypothetical protein JWO31_688, partial [Phycisphaerales bacterium]|nr:hypothetical protein [Phycisphaerales bacterium]